jgi:DTW domain-containing protein
MNILDYLIKKQNRLNQLPKYRRVCRQCKQTDSACYCLELKKFDSKISFIILIHPIEVKRKIATGRMAHLSLNESYLIQGQDYTNNELVNQLIEDPHYQSVILYPGLESKNLTNLSTTEKINLFSTEKKLRVFVIDGTWATARKMTRLSVNLKKLPRVCFTPPSASNFRVRKQPGQDCYSTLEAIHHTIELLGDLKGFDTTSRQHDQLLKVFNFMVEKQLSFIKEANLNPKATTYRREAQRKTA